MHVVVIGGGNAGMPAAIRAAEAGARVTLLEKANRLGGALWFSSHSISGAGTRMQAAKGIADTTDSHYDDIWRMGRERATPQLLRIAVDEAGPNIDWLESIGVAFTPESPYITWGHEPYSAPRTYGPVPATDGAGRPIQGSGPGRSVLHALEREVRSRPTIDVRLNRSVNRLVVNGDRVTGVELEAGEVIDADAVILATGGYGASQDLIRRWHPQYQHVVSLSPPHATGDGLVLAETAGGRLTNLDLLVLLTGGVEDQRSPGLCIYWVTATTVRKPEATGDIWVNRAGERFMAEDEPHPDVRERAVMAQPHTEVFIVMDDDMRRGVAPCSVAQTAVDRLEGRSPEVFLSAPTLAELAVAAGLPATVLERTVAAYNAGLASGTDAFGRRAMPKPLDTPPYHLIPTTGTVILTSAGVEIDASCRVIRQDGTPFDNLYAAGEVMGSGQVMGDCFAGGQGVGAALTFGLRAGTIAARQD